MFSASSSSGEQQPHQQSQQHQIDFSRIDMGQLNAISDDGPLPEASELDLYLPGSKGATACASAAAAAAWSRAAARASDEAVESVGEGARHAAAPAYHELMPANLKYEPQQSRGFEPQNHYVHNYPSAEYYQHWSTNASGPSAPQYALPPYQQLTRVAANYPDSNHSSGHWSN